MHRTEPVGYELQPFERRLAELELRGSPDPAHLAFASVANGTPTHQFYFDRFFKLVAADANDLLAYAQGVSDGSRAAAHNYLTHGLHAFKGKFFPQIVRSLTNFAGLAPGATIVDPFVGSGTTTLEAQLMGFHSHGIDRNPLAALIAETKSACLRLERAEVADAAAVIRARIRLSRASVVSNQAYLERWFPPPTLRLIARILAGIEAADVPKPFKDLGRLVLSSLLRPWSLQEPAQLRIFRRSEAPAADALALRFEADLIRATAELETTLRLVDALGLALGDTQIVHGDGRETVSWGSRKYDGLITSPPYATALPYIDTDRLSIYALGLADVRERSGLEWSMIGNREIRERQKSDLEHALTHNLAGLPSSVCTSILKIKRANDRVGVGFRRENLPALLYKYFWDMDTVLRNGAESLLPRSLCVVVIGDSHTVAGRTKIRIETASHLIACAERHGLRLEERIAMGGQTRYLPHQRNTIPDEEILLLRRD
jgi:site-specific DNA-methyltransferase (cytosine-N4-specific)